MRMCAAILTMVLAAGTATAEDWWQFQGPDRTGISNEAGLIESFGAGGPRELWRVEVGTGFAGPTIRDGKVYLLDRIPLTADVLRCLDLATGKELWNFRYEAPGEVQKDYPGSRASVTVDQKHAYMVGPLGHVHCVSLETHQPVWKAHLLVDFGGSKPNWGVAQSPLLHGQAVIVAPLSRRAGLVAYDKDTGEILWQSEPLGGLNYVSPVPAVIDGVPQVLATAQGAAPAPPAAAPAAPEGAGQGSRRGGPQGPVLVSGVDAATGKVLWQYSDWSCGIAIACPTPIGDGRFFLTGGYNAGCAMFRVRRDGQNWSTETLFQNKNCNSQMHNAVLWDGHLYANSNQNGFGLTCLDLEGNTKWKTEGNPNFDRCHFLIADGRIYAMSRDGWLRIIALSPEGYRELASAKLLGGQTIWGPMALSDGKLVMRDTEKMLCVDLRARP